MKATNKRGIARALTAGAAMALWGLLPDTGEAAVTATLASNGKSLKVVGDNAANDVTIDIDDSVANRVYVYDGNTFLGSFQSFPIEKIQVILKGGDDAFFVGLVPGASHKFEKRIDLKLGAGNDSGFVDFRGNGGFTIVQGSLEVNVNGGSGDDETFAHFARKHGGKLEFSCTMSSGNDECAANMWGDVTGGADVSFDLRGGSDDDSLWSWNTYDQKDGAYADILVTSDSTFDVRIDGGSGIDTLTPTYAGEADGDLTVIVNGSGDGDSSWGVVDLGAGSAGEVVALTLGSGGDDDLRLDVYTTLVLNGPNPQLSAAIDGGGGSDLCQSTPNVSKSNCP